MLGTKGVSMLEINPQDIKDLRERISQRVKFWQSVGFSKEESLEKAKEQFGELAVSWFYERS
jgi:hypothetical protein